MSSGWVFLVLATVILIAFVSPASLLDAIVSLGGGLLVGLMAIKVMGG